MLSLHQRAKHNQQHQPHQQAEDDSSCDEVEYSSETDEDEQAGWGDTTDTDEDLQATTAVVAEVGLYYNNDNSSTTIQ